MRVEPVLKPQPNRRVYIGPCLDAWAATLGVAGLLARVRDAAE